MPPSVVSLTMYLGLWYAQAMAGMSISLEIESDERTIDMVGKEGKGKGLILSAVPLSIY